MPAPSSAEEQHRGGMIQYGHEQEPPCLYGSWIQQWYLQRQFTDALVSQDVGGKIVPWLATSWTISDDKTVYTFEIKPGVKFTDGTPLDAQAVADNFDNWMSVDPDRRNNAATLYFKDAFKSAEATGPLTVRVELGRPYQPLLTVLSQATLGILSPTALKRGLHANCEQPVGSGPFVVETWNHGQNVVFKRNPGYNSAPANARHQGPAYVDGLVWKFLRDPTSRYGSLQAGESDVIYDVPAVDWADAKQHYQVIQHITGGTPQRLQLNTAFPPFDDIRVRQAFAMAADRKQAVQAVYGDALPFAGNPVLGASAVDYRADLAQSYPFDPDRANALLDEAGWAGRTEDGIRQKDGKPLTIRMVYGAGDFVTPDAVQALEIIQAQVRDVGFDMRFTPITLSDYYGGVHRGPHDYEIQPAYWTASSAEVFKISWRPDAGGVANVNNASRFQSPEVWSLIQAADRTFDDAKRKGPLRPGREDPHGQRGRGGLHSSAYDPRVQPWAEGRRDLRCRRRAHLLRRLLREMSIAADLRLRPTLRARRRAGAVARRLLGALGVLWAAATFTFLMQALLPGDRALLVINQAAGSLTNPSAAEIAAVNARYGFDAPLWLQYLRYVGGLPFGDFGTSYQQHQPVLDIVAAQVLPTIVLTVGSLAAGWIIAVVLTLLSAGRSGPLARLIGGVQVVLATLPPYWLGAILLVVFAIQLRLLPVEGSAGGLGLVLPTLSLGLPLAGFLGQVMQDEFVHVLDQPFVLSARTRGMSDMGVRLRHVLRHAALPGLTLSGWALGRLFSGAVLIEAVFARPGIGGVLVTASQGRDIPLVSGIVIICAALYVVTNLAVDWAYGLLDPRIRLA